MPAYYNENDKYAAQWLRNLIAAGHIAPGDVDERSIVDVRAEDLKGYVQCHFFAGIGIWSAALRQSRWDDTRPVWTGSCPCQSFSAAGKGLGTRDEKHLWPVWFELIRNARPLVVFGEQVASKDGLAWLDIICTDLENEGYPVWPIDLCAAGFGAPNIRQRLWFMAYPDGGDASTTGLQRGGEHGQQSQDGRSVPLANAERTESAEWAEFSGGMGNASEPRLPHGESEILLGQRGGGMKGEQLPNQVAHLVPSTDSGPMPIGSPAQTAKRGQLNPEHSRWLMAIPKEWGNCAPMGTRSTSKRRPGS